MIFSDNNGFFSRITGNNVTVRLNEQAANSREIKSNAKRFIEEEEGNEYLTTLFRTSLKKQLEDQVNNISDLTNQAIKKEIPFLFNSEQIPEVFKSIAIAAALKIPVREVNLQRLDVGTINGICDSMIEKAVKDGDPTLNETLEKYRTSAENYGIFNATSKYLTLDLFETVMKKLKMYGELIINGYYLETYGEKEYENGKYFYNIIEIPHLQFEFNRSKLVVYEKKGGIRTVIQPKDFTYDYMKSLLKGIEILKNTGVMKSFNNYLLPQQQQTDLTRFRQNYLRRGNNNI